MAQIMGIWTALALVAGAVIGRAISEIPPPPLWRVALPRGRSVTSAAAGSALAAIAMVWVMLSPLSGSASHVPAAEPAASHYVADAQPSAAAPGAGAGLASPQALGPGGAAAPSTSLAAARGAAPAGAAGPAAATTAAAVAQVSAAADAFTVTAPADVAATVTASAPAATEAVPATVTAPAEASTPASSPSGGVQTASPPRRHPHRRPHRTPGGSGGGTSSPPASSPSGGSGEAPAPSQDAPPPHKLPLPDLIGGHGDGGNGQ